MRGWRGPEAAFSSPHTIGSATPRLFLIAHDRFGERLRIIHAYICPSHTGRVMMKLRSALAASLILAFGLTGTAAGTSVLFVGNSFLFGSGSAVRFYRADTVTDLNSEGIGGVPALFKSFAQQAGLDYHVLLEPRGGNALDSHL